ncbi:hydroxymethylglutaryl-CoA synthase [Radiomyces spectabilis]|uniref:hydroxymethylglutaryl-CoA synthase n=1 Tax=Radiomyces spectabilis TaxID=64574 RepID=UPI00221F5EA0|nr:hydroxymethylglutaryl-CoA synthase [Radiomyces spectabilis]KAI8368194.1 hydroxymethylglutaryl-CoA synthase [Radiomyces spectabilis]
MTATTFEHYPENVGILAMEMYFPSRCVDQSEMETFDGVSAGKYTIGLGQEKMAFIDDREDIQSICLTAVHNLMEKYNIAYTDIGRLEVGTETIIDKSKSVKTTLMTLFGEHGNYEIEGIDTTNACYGGFNAFSNAVNWIESSSWDGRYAIVIAGDLALYASGAARPTSGAGVVAMLIGKNAPIVVERGLRSTHMEHAYDFYKPDMHSEYPVVDGKYSNTCYLAAFDACYNRYMGRLGKALNKEKPSMDDIDYLVCHSPYAKLVNKSFARASYNDFLKDPENEKFAPLAGFKEVSYAESLENRDLEKACVGMTKAGYAQKVGPAAFVPKQIGNMYTAAVWSGLASLISEVDSETLKDKRVLLYSYGSGLAASMISFRITGSTDGIKQKLNLRERLAARTIAKPEDFAEAMAIREKTHNVRDYVPSGNLDHIASGVYYVEKIDDKWRRFYKRKD